MTLRLCSIHLFLVLFSVSHDCLNSIVHWFVQRLFFPFNGERPEFFHSSDPTMKNCSQKDTWTFIHLCTIYTFTFVWGCREQSSHTSSDIVQQTTLKRFEMFWFLKNLFNIFSKLSSRLIFEFQFMIIFKIRNYDSENQN